MNTASGPVGTPVLEAADLASRALLADLTVSYWRARVKDKAESRKVCAEHGTKDGAAAVMKSLMPEDAPEYKALVDRLLQFDIFFDKRTRPWGETRNLRILTAEAYEPIALAYGAACREVADTYLPAFLAAYSRLREEAKVRLNGMWKEEDYPPADAIAAKFTLTLHFAPVPTGGDFRTALTGDQLAVLQAETDRASREAGAAVMRRIWGELRDRLEKMSAALGGTTTKANGEEVLGQYRDTLFTNLEELCDLLPLLNLSRDPSLDALGREARERILARFAPEQCRRDLGARAQALGEVDRILGMLPPAG